MLIQVWRGLRVNIDLPSDLRARLERQTALEVRETQEALDVLVMHMGAPAMLSAADRAEVRHIVGTIGQRDAT